MSLPGEKDVFGKADALLRRGAAGGPSETGAFPVLTDIVDETLAQAEAESPPQDLSRDIFNRVMAEVEGRLAADLERRLTLHLIPQVHAAVASAIGDLHQELANAIGDAVAEAVAHRNGK